MARWNGATWRSLGTQSEPKMSAHDIVCAHTMVGSLYGTDNYFAQSGYSGPESHFGVGGKWDADAGRGLDGVVYQWQDTLYTADANLEGNPRVISWETADNAPQHASDIEPWTDRQLDALIRGIAWCCDKASHAGCPSGWRCRAEGIPAVLIPDTKPGRRGIGYHQQGCDPWRVSGGEKWSDAYGKECPTSRRIEQLKTIVIPRVAAKLAGTEEEDDDMKANDQVRLSGSSKAFLEDHGADVGSDNSLPFDWFVQWMHVEATKSTESSVRIEGLLQQVIATQQKTNELLSQLAPPADRG
jgi:hypothetical protein